jgi:hypothetical protein
MFLIHLESIYFLDHLFIFQVVSISFLPRRAERIQIILVSRQALRLAYYQGSTS